MLSIPVASLPILGQIFDHVEVSTQYDFIFGCDITSQFINEDFLLGWEGGEYIGSVYICYLKFVFLCSTVTDIIRPALLEFSNSTLKFLDPLQSIPTSLLVLLSDEKKAGPIHSFFPKNKVFISTICFLKKYNVKFRVAKSLKNPFSFVVILKTSNI